MSSSKVTIIYGMEAQIEPSYGGAVTFAPATDAVLLAEPSVMEVGYLHAGDRAMATGTAGTLPQAAPSGRKTEFPFKVECRGLGVLYANTLAASPRDLHFALRASGLAATFSGGVGSEKWTYAPESDTFESLALRLFARGQQYDLTSAYVDFGFSFETPGFCIFDFNAKGKIGVPVDAAIPGTLGYLTPLPPKTQSVAFTFNAIASTNFKVRRAEFQLGRAIVDRNDGNDATGYAGVGAGRRSPTLTVQIEALPLATLNPWTLRDAATQFALSFQVGTTQYNRMKFLTPGSTAQLVDVKESEDDPVALWDLTFKLPCSTGAANDDFNIVFD